MSVDKNFDMVKLIKRTTVILSIVTIVEVALAVTLTGDVPQMILNVFYILMSLTKAFYIVSIFMHLKFELKFMAITILVPMFFLLFAVCTLLIEGDTWLHMRNY